MMVRRWVGVGGRVGYWFVGWLVGWGLFGLWDGQFVCVCRWVGAWGVGGVRSAAWCVLDGRNVVVTCDLWWVDGWWDGWVVGQGN